MLLEKASLISNLLDFLFIIVFCLIGSIVKDTYDIILGKNTKVYVARILISTLVSSIIIFSISDYLINMMSWKLFILPCFVGGMVGFEILGKINKLGFWLKIYSNKKHVINKIIAEELNKDNQ